MSLHAMLENAGVIDTIARELSIDKETARIGATALLPAIVAGMGRASTENSASRLPDLIGALGGGGLFDAVIGESPTPTRPGNDVLGAIFGTKDTSRSVASEVAAITGIDEAFLKKMLPILAMAVAGYVAKNSTGGGLGGILGKVASSMLAR